MKRCVAFVLSLCWLGMVSAAWADGDSRLATQAEKDFVARTRAAIARCLPRPLAGFEARDATKLIADDRVSTGCENYPMKTDYAVSWVNPEGAKQESIRESEALQRAATKMSDPSVQQKQKAIMDKNQKLSVELGQAIQRNDQARIQKIQKEMETLGKELEAIGNAQTAMVTQGTKNLANKSRVDIHVQVNTFFDSLPARAIQERKFGSGAIGYAYRDPDGKYSEYVTAMVGSWKKKVEGSQAIFEAKPNPSRPYLQAQSIRITVKGHPELTRKVLEGVDWKALQALVGK